MHIKSQPWIHSWYGDVLGFHLVPFLFLTLAVFKLPPFSDGYSNLNLFLLGVLLIDWAHIFAQWHRIYYNPLESRLAKWIYPASYLALIPLVALYVHYVDLRHLDVLLVYFVIYHFIKQQFGFIRIYSKIDGRKTPLESRAETAFIYLSMWTPVIYWHINFPKKDFYWSVNFLKLPYIESIFYLVATLYALSAGFYVWTELRRWKKNSVINIPKNLAVLAGALGWGSISLFPEISVLIMFTVVLTHDVSYTALVWMMARRDHKITYKKVKWFSWWSGPGMIFYVGVLIAGSHFIMVIHQELARDAELNYFLYGKIFNHITSSAREWQSFGWALFFATQAHHYFIDRFLWKKEKDLAYMIATGKHRSEPAGNQDQAA